MQSIRQTQKQIFYKDRDKGDFRFHIVTNNATANAEAFQEVQNNRPKFFTLNDGFRNPAVRPPPGSIVLQSPSQLSLPGPSWPAGPHRT